jgi:hypothetical protein
MPSPLIARRVAHPDLERLTAGVLVALASSCSLTAPSDGDLMDHPARVDAGGSPSKDAGDDARVEDSGTTDGGDAGPTDAAVPPRCAPACTAKT